MTTQLLAENILTDAHFLSAEDSTGSPQGSQASGFWGQPAPASANTGKFRLLAQGDASDFSYSGTTSATGAVDKTTLIDSALVIYGNDYFIGGTITITSGAASGQSRTISDFAQVTGTITISVPFTAQIVSGVTFTLTIPYATRAIEVEIVAAGDAGNATFKWNHDGATWLGRNRPQDGIWPGSTLVHNNTAKRISLCQAANGTLIVAYNEAADSKVYCKRSINNGITWSAAIKISNSNRSPQRLLVLASSRILIFMDTYMSYSDDHGLTWSAEAQVMVPETTGIPTAQSLYGVIELSSGVLFAAYIDTGPHLNGALSSDSGFSWANINDITQNVGASSIPACAQTENGNLIVVYSFSNSGHYEIRCKISEDGGYTWGNSITVLAYASFNVERHSPTTIVDIDGRIFVFCDRTLIAPENAKAITATYSDNNGTTWHDAFTVASVWGTDLQTPTVCMADGHQLSCAYLDNTNSDVYLVRRGMWEAYSGNDSPVAIEAIPQALVCGAELVWYGYGGMIGDAWTFEPEYDFCMENLIADSPSRPWRTAADNADYAVVMDLGANNKFYADGAAFFGANVRTLSIQMNDTDSWGSPSLNQSVSFDLATGAIDAASGNFIQDTSLLAGYADHELRGQYVRMTSGTSSGVTWKILDNFSSWIVLDTTAAISVSVNDTFAIFGTKAAVAFTANVKRYVRILIETQQTAENYYQVGYAALGRMVSLDRGIAAGFGLTRQANVEMLRTPAGGMIPIQGAEPKNVFELTFPNTDLGRRQLIAMVDYLRGQNVVLIPDSADLLDVYLVKATSDAKQTHKFLDRYDVVLTLEEVL